MSQRQELIALACQEGTSIARLARRFGVSRKTVYKWLGRYRHSGMAGLVERSRRPHGSSHRTPAEVEQAVLALRAKHPAWGGRKLHHRLKVLGIAAPAPSTVTRILQDHGMIAPRASRSRQRHWHRFERSGPNELWQMDFKSPIDLVRGGQCHSLTVLDDHSRYALGLRACVNQRWTTVQQQLMRLFERYGLPWGILTDNGSPWAAPRMDGSFTRLEVWMMRLDIRVLHGQPFHPQTQGKDERFHRTLDVEVLQGRCFACCSSVQSAFDPWREVYNHERPHEALGMQTPGQRYQPSERSMPAALPPIEYGSGDEVRRVDKSGQFRFQRRKLRAGHAFVSESVALRPTTTDGVWKVYYGRFAIGQVDLRQVGPGQFAHVVSRCSSRYAPSATPDDTHRV